MGQLKATIAQYFRVSGESTQHRGVEPDIPFEATYDKTEQGERSLENALPWSKIAPTHFGKSLIPTHIVHDLTNKHAIRVKNNQKYQSLVKLYDLNEELLNQKHVTLNEVNRKKLFSEIEELRKQYEEIIGINSKAEENQSQEEIDLNNDVLLFEAARISADLGSYWNADAQRMIVQH